MKHLKQFKTIKNNFFKHPHFGRIFVRTNLFSSIHLTPGQGPYIGQLGPWGPLSEPQNNNIYP
jgi:hypothetical protein